MNYFVTGATGLLWGLLVQQLVTQQGHIYVLVCESLMENIDALRAQLPARASARIIPVYGDIAAPILGLSANDLEVVKGNVDQFFHFTTVCDVDLDEASQVTRTITGTTNAVRAARAMNAACIHHISSPAGDELSPGTFVEESFEEVDILNDPFFLSDNQSEKVVRLHCEIPYRLYRPAAAHGHSRPAEIARIAKAYSPFKTIH